MDGLTLRLGLRICRGEEVDGVAHCVQLQESKRRDESDQQRNEDEGDWSLRNGSSVSVEQHRQRLLNAVECGHAFVFLV